ncbi:Ankrd17, partial [Symbiodinium pilosum]
ILDPMLQKMAACGSSRDDSHMCRNLHKLIEKSGRALQLPISTAWVPIKTSRRGRPLKTKMVDYPLLRPSDWLTCIFKTGGQFLLAGQTLDDIEAFGDTLETFWSRYTALDPHLEFEGNPRLRIPYLLHGDEGRGRGHSLCTRLLLAVLPSVLYVQDKTLDAVLSALVQDLVTLQVDGIDDWWNVKGNIKSLAADYVPSNPFKTWLEPSPLRLLPHADDPKLIRVDAAHTWAINGVGKDLYASSLILLSRMGLFGKNGSIERRLQAAFEKFQDFLNRTGKSSTIDIFNFMTLKCSKYNSYPSGLGKGHDCAVVGAWLAEELAGADPASLELKYRAVFDVLRFTVRVSDQFWRGIYSGGMWLDRANAQELCVDGWHIVAGYSTLASLSAKFGHKLYHIRPKLHMLAHIVLFLQHQCDRECQFILNVSTFMTWSDEDFIGNPQPLATVAEFGDLDSLKVLLDAGASLHKTTSTGGEAIHYAAKGGHQEVLTELLARRASLDARGPDGAQPLHWAAMEGSPDVIDFLIRHGAKPNSQMVDGATTPLHLSSASGHRSLLKALLSARADPYALDGAKLSVVQIARSRGHEDEILSGLRNAGVDVPSAPRSTEL